MNSCQRCGSSRTKLQLSGINKGYEYWACIDYWNSCRNRILKNYEKN